MECKKVAMQKQSGRNETFLLGQVGCRRINCCLGSPLPRGSLTLSPLLAMSLSLSLKEIRLSQRVGLFLACLQRTGVLYGTFRIGTLPVKR